MKKNTFRSLIKEQNKYRFDQHIPSLIMAIFIGVLGGYGAVLFRFVIKAPNTLFIKIPGISSALPTPCPRISL
jgi:hypothetical protein